MTDTNRFVFKSKKLRQLGLTSPGAKNFLEEKYGGSPGDPLEGDVLFRCFDYIRKQRGSIAERFYNALPKNLQGELDGIFDSEKGK